MQIGSLLASVIHPASPATTKTEQPVDNQTRFLNQLREEHIAELEKQQQILIATEAAQSHTSCDSVQVPVMPKVHETVMIGGLIWNDKNFAGGIDGYSNRVSIEEKSINWHATGTDVLTKEQRDTLREQYDIDNLSEQDFYDLIADLTNLNVVSAEECTRLFVKHFPIGECLLIPGRGYDEGYERILFQDGWCNFLKFLDRELKHLGKFLDWMNSDSPDGYKACNPQHTPVVTQELLQATITEMETYQKFSNILQSIVQQE